MSAREQETLSYIARGLTHAQTASRMGITEATVNTHIERIRRKLGLGNKAELTRMAINLQQLKLTGATERDRDRLAEDLAHVREELAAQRRERDDAATAEARAAKDRKDRGR